MATTRRAPLKAPDFRAYVNAAVFAACIVGLAGSPLAAIAPPAVPAKQTEWPVPRGPARSVDLLTCTQETLPLPLAAAAVSPYTTLNPTTEQVGPAFRLRHAALLTWTQNLQETTLAPALAVLYGPAYEVHGPHFIVRAAQTLTAPNLLQSTLGAVAAAPFKQVDWPIPRAPQRSVDLGGPQDTPLPLLQRQGNNQYDWSVPKGQPPARQADTTGFPQPIRDYATGLNAANRPHIEWPVPKGLQPLNVGFTESLLPLPLAAVAAAPFEQSDWQNPRAPAPLNVGFVQGSLPSFLQLQGSNQYDWPVPKAAARLHVGWVQGFPEPILNYAIGLNDANKRPADWPVPRGPQRSIDALTWTQTLALQLTAPPVKPFNQSDWPLPVQRIYRQIADTTGFPQPILNFAVGLNDGRWRNLDWPNPRGALPNQPLGWTQDLQKTPFTSPQVPAPAQRDWPNPGLGKPPLNTGFVASFPLSAHTPFKQADWPVPRGLGPRQADSSGFPLPIRDYAGGLNDANKRPSDWPVPRGPQRSIDALTWTQALALNLTAAPTKPFNQNDWPLSVPRTYRQIAETRGFETPIRNYAVGLNDANKRKYDWPNPIGRPPLNVGTVQGFPEPILSAQRLVTSLRNYDWPVPKGRPPLNVGGAQGIPAPIISALRPFSHLRKYDWPVPAGPRASISLRTWTQSLLQGTLFSSDAVEGGPADEPERVICLLPASRVVVEPELSRASVVPVSLRVATVPELSRVAVTLDSEQVVDSNEFRDEVCAPFANADGIPIVGAEVIPTPSGEDAILLEDGTYLLLENGDRILLEGTIPVADSLLLEGDDHLLLESGDKVLLEE